MKARRIYVASSWRNPIQPEIVAQLAKAGHEVYDFRNPAPGQKGFAWRDCGGEAAADGPGTGARTIPAYLEALQSDRAAQGFAFDFDALNWADTCVLVLPCGRSAHLEAGYAIGQGKDTYILLHPDQFEPELMYLLGHSVHTSLDTILESMRRRMPGDVMRWHQENGGNTRQGLGPHAVRLLREVVELCVVAGAKEFAIVDAVRHEIDKAHHRGQFGGDPVAIGDEWADCALLLDVIAGHAGINPHAQRRVKMDVLWEREYEPHPDGYLWRKGPYSRQVKPAAAWPFPSSSCPELDRCPDCGREKARSADDAAAGACAKWYAVRDREAREDCARLARERALKAPEPEPGNLGPM